MNPVVQEEVEDIPVKNPSRSIKYKAVKGDEIDELFMPHLNKANLSFDVKRLAKGQYLFGSRKI